MTETNDDLVYLQVGEYDHADGQLMPRQQMPNDAYPSAFTVRLSSVADETIEGADRDIEVWVVAR